MASFAASAQKASDDESDSVNSGARQASRKPGRYEEVRQQMSNTESIMQRKASPETSRTSVGGRGRPLQVVVANEPYQFSLNTASLKQIFQDPRVVDSKVAILSVAGSCRHGKSFLLNFFLKYLRAQGALPWLNNEENVLEDGFSWVTGVEPHTSGIVMWSEPFMVRDSKGDTVALLLMDTQGAFNCESTLKESIHIFSLSVMISSIQIYNLSSNIHETDLQHLQLFTEYSKLAMAEGIDRAFQHLVFLVRDWQYPYQYPYGAAGGQALIERRLQTFDSQHPELRDLREELRKCFSRISCFLLPHPGFKATVGEHFKGEIKDLEEGFKTSIFHLVPFLIGKDNLVVKEFKKSPLTGKEIMEYFMTYFNIFRTNELPHPKSVLQMTSEANNLAATTVAQDHYTKTMNRKFGEGKPYAEPKAIRTQHEITKQESLRIFDLTPKMGSQELSDAYARKLDAHLDEWFVEFAKSNDLKVTGQLGMTPGILFVTIVVLYTISGLLTLLSLDFLSFVPDVVSYCVVGLLVTWLLVKYTGEHQDVSDVVDGIAVAIWQAVYLPIWIRIDHNAVKDSSSPTPR